MEESQPANVVRPRKLSSSEIEDIVNGLPRQSGTISKVIDKSMEQQKDSLRAQLESIVIVPAGIAQLKETIYSQYEDTKAVPGTVVGIRASLRLGAPLTQGALNSFHQSGARKESLKGIDAVTALITASGSKKGRSVTIHFNDKTMGIDDVIATSKNFVQSTVSSLTEEPIVDVPSALFDEEPSWYSLYRDTVGPIPTMHPTLHRIPTDDKNLKVTHETSILELNMNVYKLYVNGVTTGDIARKIEEVTNKDGGDNVICVYSPTKIGKIHIYPNNDVVAATIPDGATVPDASLYFINSTLLGKLSEIVIKGVKDISALHPVDYSVWNLVQREERLPNGGWKITLNHSAMHIMGIGRNEVLRLLKAIGVETIGGIQYKPNELYVKVSHIPEGKDGNISPGDLVTHYDEVSEKAEEDFNKRKQQKEIPPDSVFKETPYQRTSRYWYAETEGSNLSAVRSMYIVDPVHTYSNDINEIYTILGIEATRNFIILRILDIIEQGGGNVSPKDVMVLADNMVNYGVITKMTGPSMQKNVGFLTAATSQRPVDIFRDASANGGYEEIAGAAASIIVGNLPKIGTVYHNHPELSNKIDEMIQTATKGGHVNLDDQDFSDSISNMEGLLYGESRVQSDDIDTPSFVYGPTIDKTVPIVSMPIGKAKPVKPIRVIPRGADNVMLKEAVDDVALGSCYDPNINITFDTSANVVTIESHEITTKLITQQDIEPPITRVPVIVPFVGGPPRSLLSILAGRTPSPVKVISTFVENQQVLDFLRIPKTVVRDTGSVKPIDMGTLVSMIASL